MAEAAAPLSKLDILIAQLESLAASASSQPPDPLICFDLLSDLLSSLDDYPKANILGCQRKCEDALQALLVIGARPPVRRLCAKALIQIISKGDSISIYSRASSLQGWLLESRKIDTAGYIGLATCLGALYRSFGQKLASGLSETSNIVAKLIKFSEVSVRQAALQLLQDALEGSGGGGPTSAYSEALRVVLRVGSADKSSIVRTTAASCLHAFALAGGPGIGNGGLESCSALCVKALEDPSQPVRNAFASALGALLALGLHPDAQVQPHGKLQSTAGRTVEGGLQKHLIGPFVRATGPLYREIRVGLSMAWVSFLQGMHFTYGHSDFELQNFAIQAMAMLSFNVTSQINAHCQACVLYILRVGIVEQMSEPAQKEFLSLMTKQLSLSDTSASMLVVILRTISHLLSVLGEVPSAAREPLENSLVMALSNPTMAVRVETALTIRVLTVVDPFCTNSLMSFGVTTIRAVREILAVEKGDRLRQELDSLHGQTLMLGAILAASPRFSLGLPSWLPAAILDIAKRLILDNRRNPASAGLEKEGGWLLIASVITSMRKEEMQEQEFDIIALWTAPFGGSSEVQLRQAESNLIAEVCGWSAAVEALTAFVKSYVVPNFSSKEEGIILQPVLGYLNVALAYLSSTKLQQVAGEVKQAVDTLLMRTLMAYRALPNAFCYRNDHDMLLDICSGPFKYPAVWGQSSCLRQLLDYRDSILGPWVPGRDSFEDDLRAFDGGSDGPLPCIWDSHNISAFPQPFSVSTLLLNELLLCFGSIFAAQKEPKKLLLLDILEASAKLSKKQSFQEANATNICVTLLASLKETLRMRSSDYEPEFNRRLQLLFQGIMAEETSTTPQRRAAAEGLGILARLGNDVFAARLTKSLLADASGVLNTGMRASMAFALGCIHRSKGGMALSVLVPATVQILCLMSRDPKPLVHIWSLHSLWLTVEAAGLTYVPHVQVTMSLVMEILHSEEHTGPEVRQCLGRLINAIVAVIGPELSPGSSFFSRCKSVIAEISFVEEPASLLESVLFTQQLVLFAPQALSVHMHVQKLTPTLGSKQPSLRQAAVCTLRHLTERDPVSMIEEQIEEKLFAMLDTETDPSIIQLVRMTLVCLLEAACPMYVFRWLHLCRNVVLATSSTIAAGSRAGSVDAILLSSNKDLAFADDEEGMIEKKDQQKASAISSNGIKNQSREGDQLPRYSTRLFAAECLVRLPIAVGKDPRHFNLALAKDDTSSRLTSKSGADWLVMQLSQLVALAYQVSTGVFESLREKGVLLLVLILQKFGDTGDPDFSGHLILEQYQAQFLSALRTALDINAAPLLLDAGLQLSSRIITSGISNADAGVFKRVITLLSHLLINLDDLQFPSYAEWVGCKVQISLLRAYASIKNYSYACMTEGSNKFKEGLCLWMLLVDDDDRLRVLWTGLLRDYGVLKIFKSSQLQTQYKPFLSGLLLPAIVLIVQPYLQDVWPVVLEAVTLSICTNSLLESEIRDLGESSSMAKLNVPISISTNDFHHLWALCFSILCQLKPETSKSMNSGDFKSISLKKRNHSESQKDDFGVVALKGLKYLVEQGLQSPELLSAQLIQELLQIVMHIEFQLSSATWKVIFPILEQVLMRSPDEFFASEDWLLIVTESCIYHSQQVLSSISSRELVGEFKDDSIISTCFKILEILTQRSPDERKTQLLPVILLMGLEFIKSSSTFLASAVDFVSKLTALVITSAVDQKASILASIILNLSESFASLIKACNADADVDPGNVSKVVVFLELLLSITQVVIDAARNTSNIVSLESSTRYLILQHCTQCFYSALIASHIEVQLAALQTLRGVAQAAITEEKHEVKCELPLLMMKDLGSPIVGGIYTQLKNPLTAKAAASVGERLKLLVLLHSLVRGNEAQVEVLHILLPTIIAAASANIVEESQITEGLRTVAVKLVTHLASQPDCAIQLKSVLLEMPTELRQKLQDILRASATQKATSANTVTPVFPTIAQKLVMPAIVPPEAPIKTESLQLAHVGFLESGGQANLSNEDDDWDDFQSYPAEDDGPMQDSEMQSDSVNQPVVFGSEMYFTAGNPVERDSVVSEDTLTVSIEETSELVCAAADKTESNKADLIIEREHDLEADLATARDIKINDGHMHSASDETESVNGERLSKIVHVTEAQVDTKHNVQDNFAIPSERPTDEVHNDEAKGKGNSQEILDIEKSDSNIVQEDFE